MTAALRLRAVDTIDLSVIAAHLQDALAQVGDMGYEPAKRRFAILFNRFMWEDIQAEQGKSAKADKNAPYRRVRSALHFDAVQRVRTQGLKLGAMGAVSELLTVAFEPNGELAGAVKLTFAGGGAIKLDVECLDVWLTDISAPWPTKNRPGHGDVADEPLG
ncbi:MAG: DUF2948 family protein [Alphaproteobacteria bacterium]|nr:DUF2948 family protein [Alphaproteobacteria bacterium]